MFSIEDDDKNVSKNSWMHEDSKLSRHAHVGMNWRLSSEMNSQARWSQCIPSILLKEPENSVAW